MRTVSIFSSYKQENQFTNGLISLLELSKKVKPQFTASFLRDILDLEPDRGVQTFHVLKEIEGAADAELCGKNFCIRIETKIWSSTLRDEQVERRLRELDCCKKKLKRLVLLTPDDSNSAYARRFRDPDRTRILHLEWRRVYEFLKRHQNDMGAVFSELTDQFLALIYDTIFEQDIVGVILFIRFGKKSGIDPNTYLDEIASEPWKSWSTPPKEYKGLDGTYRKLLLYDKQREAITVEGEIQKRRRTTYYPDYPWTHFFAPGTLHVLPQPIPVGRIRRLDRFKFFGKCQTACWNVTHEEYRVLTAQPR